MNIKKHLLFLVSALILGSNTVSANEIFKDNNASAIISTTNTNAKLIVAELNTGKIVTEKDSNQLISYKNLINKIAVFALSEHLRDGKITLDHRIPISGDEILQKFQIKESISVKDAIFLLEQENSTSLAISVLSSLNIEISQAQGILDRLTLSDTELNKFEVSDDNKISAKNLAYLTQEILRNYYPILQITSAESYILESGQQVSNDIKISLSDSYNLVGLSYDDKNSTLILNNKDTSFIITILDSNLDKEAFFLSLQNLALHLFNNYSYSLIIKAGNNNIKNQNIIVNNDLYDLLYKDHSKESLNFFLMNDKIILLQNYATLSANNASVFSDYKTTNNEQKNKKDFSSNLKEYYSENTKIKGFTNKEKLNSIISNTSFIITIIFSVYIIFYVVRKLFKKVFRRNK